MMIVAKHCCYALLLLFVKVQLDWIAKNIHKCKHGVIKIDLSPCYINVSLYNSAESRHVIA